ncbi:MAG TPA: hypothetical protein VGJ00_03645 [Rhabdochlamydiaceae bacterium]|jgi:hypothetical protein
MKKIICIVVLFFVSSCDERKSKCHYNDDGQEKLTNQIILKVAEQLQREKNLQPCGFGGRAMDQVKMLAISFNYFKQIDIEEGRELLVSAGKLFLDAINENEKVRPYLINYPFLPENIQVRIFLKNEDGTFIEQEKLHVVSIINGKLLYKIETSRTPLYEIIHSETFEEAAEILKESEKNRNVVHL